MLSVDHANAAFGFGTRPTDGRKPTTLQNAAGLRSEPPVSEPLTTGANPQAKRDGGAAGRSAARLRQVVGIARRAENFVECLRARAEFRRVGFADDDRARAPHAIDNDIVFGGNVVFKERRSKCSADAACFQQVLVRDGQAMQRTQSFFVRLHLIGFRGGVGGHFRHQSHDGVHFRIYALDLFQMRGQRFARREFLRADQPGHLDGAQEANGGFRGLRLQAPSDRIAAAFPAGLRAALVYFRSWAGVYHAAILVAQASACGF